MNGFKTSGSKKSPYPTKASAPFRQLLNKPGLTLYIQKISFLNNNVYFLKEHVL